MKSTAFFQLLNKVFSVTEQKQIFESIRLDPILWSAFSNVEFAQKVIDTFGKDLEEWSIGKICLFAMGLSEEILAKPVREKLYLKKAVTLFESTRTTTKTVENLDQAALIALALYERGAKTQNWKGLLTDLGLQHFESRSQFVTCWRSPLAILYSLLNYSNDFLLGIAGDKDDNLSISLINHIIAVQIFSKNQKAETLKTLVEKSHLDKQISWYQSFPTQLGFLVPEISDNLHQPLPFRVADEKNMFNSFKNIEEQIQENVLHGYRSLLDKSNNQAHAHFSAAKSVTRKLLDFIDLLCIEAESSKDAASVQGKDSFFEDIVLSKYDDSLISQQYTPESGEPKGILLKLASLIELQNKGEQNRARELAARDFEHWLNQRRNNWPAINEIELIQRIDHRKIIDFLKELDLVSMIENYVTFLEDISKNHPNITPVIMNSINQYANSEEQYEKYKINLILEPENERVRGNLIKLLALKKDWETLYEEWATAEANGEIDGSGWENYAIAACNAGKLEQAKRLCEKLNASGAERGTILMIQGKIHYLEGRFDQAKECLVESMQTATGSADAWLALADIYMQEENFVEALSTLRSAVLAIPDSDEIHYALAAACLQNHQYAQALPYLKKAIALNPENENYCVDLISTLKELGHLDEANSQLTKARIKWPNHSGVAFLDAMRALEREDKEQALRAFEDAVANTEKPAFDVLLLYARTLLDDHEHQFSLTEMNEISVEHLSKAQRLLQWIVKNANEKASYANILLGEVYFKNNEIEAAHSIYLDLINPNQPENEESGEWGWRISAGMGMVKMALKENELGLVMLKDAVTRNPEHIGIKQVLAQAFLDMKLEDDAIRIAKDTYAAGSTNVKNLVWYSDFMKRVNQPDEVIKALENANLLSNYDDEISLRLANEYVAVGNVQGANASLDSILENDSADYATLRETTTTYLRLNNYEKAYIAYKKALVTLPQLSVENQIEYIYLCYLHERWQEVLDQVQRLIAQNYAFIFTYVMQAESLGGLDKFSAALSAYEQATQSTRKLSEYLKFKKPLEIFVPLEWITQFEKQETVLLKLAQAATKANEFDKSLKCINQVIQTQPQEAAYRLFAVDIAMQLNDFETARDYLTAVDLLKQTENDETLSSLYQGQVAVHNIFNAVGIQASNQNSGFRNAVTHLLEIHQKIAAYNFAEAGTAFSQHVSSTGAAETFALKAGGITLLSNVWKNTCFRLAVMNALNLFEFAAANALIAAWHYQGGSNEETAFYTMLLSARYESTKPLLVGLKVKQHRSAGLEQALKNGQPGASFSKACAHGKTLVLAQLEAALNLGAAKTNTETLQSLFSSLQYPSALKLHLIDRLAEAGLLTTVVPHLGKQKTPWIDVLTYCKYLLDTNGQAAGVFLIEKEMTADPISCAILRRELSQQKEYEQALAFSEECLGLWPQEELWKVENALLYEKMGNASMAAQKWDEIIQQTESIQDVIYPYLDLLLRNGKSDEVISLLEKHKSALEGSKDYFLYQANAYYTADKFEHALKSVQAAKNLQSDDLQTILLEGRIYLSLQQIDKARQIANLLIQKQQHSVDGYQLLVLIHEKQGKFNEALKVLDQGLVYNPDHRDLLINKVWNLREVGNLPAALQIVSQLSVKNQEDWEAISLLALIYNDMENYKAAEDNAKKSLRLSMDQPGIMMLLGNILRKQGHLDQAIEYFSQAAAATPKVIDPCLQIGDIYMEQHNYPSALDAYQEAMYRNENDPRPYYKAGVIMREVKDYQGAEKMLRIAANLAPKDVSIRRQLAGVIALNFVHAPLEAK